MNVTTQLMVESGKTSVMGSTLSHNGEKMLYLTVGARLVSPEGEDLVIPDILDLMTKASEESDN